MTVVIKRRSKAPTKDSLTLLQYAQDGATYSNVRRYAWGLGNFENFNAHGSLYVVNGIERQLDPSDIVLVPRTNPNFKDVWHCGSLDTAKALIAAIAKASEITALELRGKWVWVTFIPMDADHVLTGQKLDDRHRVLGRR